VVVVRVRVVEKVDGITGRGFSCEEFEESIALQVNNGFISSDPTYGVVH
jgi:hypothetical protein